MNHVAFHGQLYKWVIVAVLHLREMLYMHGQSLVQEPITSRKYFFFIFPGVLHYNNPPQILPLKCLD